MRVDVTIHGNYNDEMTREFYASYVAIVWNSSSKQTKPVAQPTL